MVLFYWRFYFLLFSGTLINSNAAYLTNQKHIQDSLHIDSINKITPQQTAALKLDSLHADSLSKLNNAGNFAKAVNIPEQLVTVENNLIKAVFTTKGGAVKYVELKKYNSQTGGKVILGESDKDGISYTINTGANKAASTSEMNFVASQPVKNADGSQTIEFKLADSGNAGITHQYIIKPDSYLIDWNIFTKRRAEFNHK